VTSDVIEAGDGLPLTVPALMAARVAVDPDHVLLAVDEATLTYAQAAARSADLARALLAVGVGLGSRVAILHPNSPEFVVAWLAAARIGAVSVPLSTFSTSPELVALLHGVDATVLLAAAAYRSQDYVASLAGGIGGLDLGSPPPLESSDVPSLRRVVFDGEAGPALHPGWTLPGLLAAAPAVGADVLATAESAVTPAEPLVIVHTSGSTSEPKGVVHTGGALIRHLDNLNQLRRYDPSEILFSNSPFFWIGGFAYALLGTVVAGATLVCSNEAAPAGLLDTVERYRPTMVNGFAASVAHVERDPSFAGRDLSSIRRGNLYPIMPADARPADPELRHAMLGMTEAGSVCLASDDESDQPESRRGSFGRPAPGFEATVRPVDEVDVPVTECAPGEVGELWFRGPFLMEGYDGRERHQVFTPEGWYRTGDLVTRDEDGFVYFRGRSSDMIKTAGANVSPREVEAAVLSVSGLVAHVTGIDDADRGQLVAALVRAPDGADVDVDDLRARLRQRLSAYKVPRRILVVRNDQVPMMSSGKVDLLTLKELLSSAEVAGEG
jgi:acyl-CoA synthetase (AMP-forming)/AMP-acid ligase II